MGQLDSGNAAWILTSASLVFLMTPGVAFFYGGMVRAKAVLNMMIMEAAALSVTMVIWVLRHAQRALSIMRNNGPIRQQNCRGMHNS